MLKRNENKQFRLVQDVTMGAADLIQFIRLRNQLVVAVRDFSKEENLPPVQVKLLAKDMGEQLKLKHRVVEVVGRPHRKICATMWRSQRLHMFKCDCLKEERTKKNSNKLFM